MEGQAKAEEDSVYDCPICHDVLKTPIRTKSCRHVFCRDCFRSAVAAQGPRCPMCRSPVSETEKRAADVQQQMRRRQGECRACGTKWVLSKMRVHYKNCQRYMEEYGSPEPTPRPVSPARRVPMDAIPTARTLPVVRIPSQHPTSTERPRAAPPDPEWVYPCPYCPLQGLTDMALVHHCVSSHSEESYPAVCPICVTTPWGDASYRSRNLIGHLSTRHRFSFHVYMNVLEEEESQFCLAIQRSLQ